MNNEQLNEFLAEEVMGWHKERNDYVDSRYRDIDEFQWVDRSGKILYHVTKSETLTAGGSQHYWHPTTDIAQAMMCAKEADKELHIHIADHHGCPFEVESKFGEFSLVCHSVEEVARAICHAIYEAVKGGE